MKEGRKERRKTDERETGRQMRGKQRQMREKQTDRRERNRQKSGPKVFSR